MWWFVAIRQQAITWAKIAFDPDLCLHVASLGLIEA